MRCQYCNKRVGIAKQLKGQPFCSDEHRDLYLHGSANEVIERLRSSFTEFAPKRLDAERPEVKPEPAKPVRPQAKSVTEPEASQVAPETSPAQAGVFASSTPAPDPRESDFIRFPMVEPRPSAGPLRIPLGDAIQTPLRHPQLPSWQADYRPASEVSSLIPHAPACDSSWECHRGLGPAMPPLAGILRPRRDVARMVPSVRRENMRAWPSVPFFATSPGFPMPSKQLLVAQAAHLPAAITLSATLGNQMLPSTSNVFALGAASSPQAIKSGAPLRCEPSSSDLNSAWLQVEIASQLPRTAVLPPAPIGLSRATDAAPLGCSSATSLPPAIETAAPTGSAPPLLLLFRPSSIASAAMVASPVAPESTTPLHCEPPSSDVNSAWLQIVIASQLPRVTTVLPPVPVGLNLAAHTVLLGCSSAANFPPALETAASVTSPLPFLLLFRPSSIAAPAMPLWLNTRPLKREASRPPAAVSEQRRGLSAAILAPVKSQPAVPCYLAAVTVNLSSGLEFFESGRARTDRSECESRPHPRASIVVPKLAGILAHTVAAAARRGRLVACGAHASLAPAASHPTDSSGQPGNASALYRRGTPTAGFDDRATAGFSAFRAGAWHREFRAVLRGHPRGHPEAYQHRRAPTHHSDGVGTSRRAQPSVALVFSPAACFADGSGAMQPQSLAARDSFSPDSWRTALFSSQAASLVHGGLAARSGPQRIGASSGPDTPPPLCCRSAWA